MLGLIDQAGLDALRVRLSIRKGYALRSLDRFEEALAAFGRAQDLYALPHLAARPELDAGLARLAMNEGVVLKSLGRFEEALAAYSRAQDLYALPHLAARPELDAGRASLAMNEGVVLKSLGRFEEALAACSRAQDLHALSHLAARPELDASRARLAMNEGLVLTSLGRRKEAAVAFVRACDLHKLPHLLKRRKLDDSRAHFFVSGGGALSSLGRRKEALKIYGRARGLYALPHLAARPELDRDRARLAMNEGRTLASLGRIEEALSACRTASLHWSSQRELTLPEQARFAVCLTVMSGLLGAMAAEDASAARAWALRSSDRLVEMLDLALSEGKIWDDLRRHFARFHARCLAWCLSSSDPADRALVPRILAAVQGRRLAAEALEQAMALGGAAAPEIRDVLAIKAEMRALLEELGAEEGSYGAGSPGRAGPV